MFGRKRQYVNPYVYQYENNHFHISYDIMNKWRIFDRPMMYPYPQQPFFSPYYPTGIPPPPYLHLQQQPSHYIKAFSKPPYSYPQTNYGKSYSRIY
ncbi:unnamed protein product [Cunninghamella echinulata]